MSTRAELLKKLAKSEGYRDTMKFLEWCASDCVNPGICRACEAVNSDMEPDQREGCCEFCGENKVEAALVLAGYM